MLRDLAILAISTVLLAAMMQAVDAWQKEVRLHRRSTKLQQLVLAIERARGNGLDLDALPKAIAEVVRKRLHDDGIIVVLAAREEPSSDALGRIRSEARRQPMCILIEGIPSEVREFIERTELPDVSPMAVPVGVGSRLVDGEQLPCLIEVGTGLVLRRSSLTELAVTQRLRSNGQGADPADSDRDPRVGILETRR